MAEWARLLDNCDVTMFATIGLSGGRHILTPFCHGTTFFRTTVRACQKSTHSSELMGDSKILVPHGGSTVVPVLAVPN